MTFIFYPEHNPFDFYGLRDLYKEFSGAWTKFVSLDLTEADRLNGIQSRGMAVLGGTALRKFDRKRWSEWRDLSHAAIPRSLLDSNGDQVIVVMEKRNNRWCFKAGSAESSFDPDSFAASKKSCSILTSANPRSEP
jgi:hypothetical protein